MSKITSSFRDIPDDYQLEIAKLRCLLYRAVVELEYVQNAFEGCGSHMCASPIGKEIVAEGMKLLGVADLSNDELPSWLVIA